jgi:hypothetical protein
MLISREKTPGVEIMYEINDSGIRILYQIARDEEGAEITEHQKEAVRQLKKLARGGNPDAGAAVRLLQRVPDMHPFLREVLAA